ncbi:hypothetical protein ACIP6V_05250 [Streptomyces sp. NPDC088770]|uniref:hypothetical protein n=1 Tax=Streptomyces sp. NPDC088770 TaxID=3365895 RepID=UPI0038088632
MDPPTRGIHTLTPRRDPHPCSAPLLDLLVTAFGASRSDRPAHRPADAGARERD